MKIIRKHIDAAPEIPVVPVPSPQIFYDVVVMEWEETERGWGTRFDGISLHLDEDAAKAYEKEYWSKMPNSTPDEYERPTISGGWWAKITDKDIYNKLVEKKSLRLYKHTDEFKQIHKFLEENHMWRGCYKYTAA